MPAFEVEMRHDRQTLVALSHMQYDLFCGRNRTVRGFLSVTLILIAILFGPVYGMLPPLLYGLVMGFTVDIFSLYYMPVGILLGLVTGLVSRKYSLKSWRIIPGAFLITIPGTIASAVITAVLFGGITSSGTTVLVQILNKAGLNLTASVFIVQILADYLDRLISLFLVAALLAVLPQVLYRDND